MTFHTRSEAEAAKHDLQVNIRFCCISKIFIEFLVNIIAVIFIHSHITERISFRK